MIIHLSFPHVMRTISHAKNLAFYPFLFAIFPVAAFKATNIAIGAPEEMILPSLISVTAAACLCAAVNPFLKNFKRTAMVVAACIIWFYSFGAAESLISIIGFKIGALVLALLYTGIFAGLTVLLVKRVKDLAAFTGLQNTISGCLVVYNLITIGIHSWQIGQLMDPIIADNLRQDAGVTLKPPGKLRDIYYVILDGCGSSSLFRDYYDYDNSVYIKFLQSRGFVVPPNSISNYDETLLSLASSLNMQQVVQLKDIFGPYNDVTILGEMIKNNRVQHLLKRLGYKFVNVSSGVFCSDNPPGADFNFRQNWMNVFNLGILDTTILPACPGYLEWMADQVRQQRLCFFDRLDEIKAIDGPKFVFAHILLPHPPFLFARNGESVVRLSTYNSFNKEGYLEQEIFTEGLVKKAVASLTNADEEHLPIVVIQGDHGPQYCADELTPLYCSTRFRILNACLLPGAAEPVLYDGISPVNTFRRIFDLYFQSDFKTLKDEAFYSPQTRLFDFQPANAYIVDKKLLNNKKEK